MFDRYRGVPSTKESSKEVLEGLVASSDNFLKEAKRTYKIAKRLRGTVRNCKSLNRDLMNALIDTDVLNRREGQVVNSSYYLTLKNIEIAFNYQRHAFMKLSQLPDMEQMNKILADSEGYLKLSLGFILKGIRLIKDIAQRR